MRTFLNHGGDIHAKSVFEKILSIGYEMETTDLRMDSWSIVSVRLSLAH